MENDLIKAIEEKAREDEASPSTRSLVQAIVKATGGDENFVNNYLMKARNAASEAGESAIAFKYDKLLTDLRHRAEQLEQTSNSFVDMSPEDLDAYIKHAARTLLEEDPGFRQQILESELRTVEAIDVESSSSPSFSLDIEDEAFLEGVFDGEP